MKLSKFLERLGCVITNSKDDIDLNNEQMNEIVRLLNIKLIEEKNSKDALIDSLFNYIGLLNCSNIDLLKINCDLLDSAVKLAVTSSDLVKSTEKLLK